MSEKPPEIPKDKLLPPSQAIRIICEILTALGTPETAIKQIKKLCWNISDYHTLQKAVKDE